MFSGKGAPFKEVPNAIGYLEKDAETEGKESAWMTPLWSPSKCVRAGPDASGPRTLAGMNAHVRRAVAASPDYPFSPVLAAVKLDQNESPDDFPPALKAEALAVLAQQAWNRYPDLHAEQLSQAIARHDGWDPAGVVATTGSNVLIALLIQLTALQGRVVTVKPNFALYGLDATLLGAQLTEVPLNNDFTLDVPALLRALNDASPGLSGAGEPRGVIYLPRPHAPTGSVVARQALQQLLQASTDWLLVIDEAYHQFCGDDVLALALQYPHVVVLRTFSKAWGLAGMRLGYALASNAIARQLRKLVPPFGVSLWQSVCAQVALAHPAYMHDSVARIRQERSRLTAALQQHPHWTVYPSEANFLLIRTPDAGAAVAGLLAQGVLVRRQDSLYGLEGCIRVSIGTPAENDAFLAAAANL